MKTLLTIHEVDSDLDEIKSMINMAKSEGAHLNIIVLGVIRTVPVTAAPGVPAYYYDTTNQEVVDEAKQRVTEVNTLLQEEGISASVTLECRDLALVEKVVQRHAMFADATVFQNQIVLATDVKTRAFNGALMETGRPVILLGSNADKLPNVKKVMYAWQSEPEASKAVHASLTWIGGAVDAHVVLVDPTQGLDGPHPGDDMATYLARQDLAVTVDRIASGDRDVADVLLEHANDIDADLLVMGGYSHSRLREWLLGGTTRDILQKAKLPVLMAH